MKYAVHFEWPVAHPMSTDALVELANEVEADFNRDDLFKHEQATASPSEYKARCEVSGRALVLFLHKPDRIGRKDFEFMLNASKGILRFKTRASVRWEKLPDEVV